MLCLRTFTDMLGRWLLHRGKPIPCHAMYGRVTGRGRAIVVHEWK